MRCSNSWKANTRAAAFSRIIRLHRLRYHFLPATHFLMRKNTVRNKADIESGTDLETAGEEKIVIT